MKSLFRVIAVFMMVVCWLLNGAALVGFFLLRRRIAAPQSQNSNLRLHIMRPYKTETDANSAQDELLLMHKLFVAAKAYGNAYVTVVTNKGDDGLAEIRKMAAPYGDKVAVIEADEFPADIISGKMNNIKTGWLHIDAIADDGDILVTTDSDTEVSVKLLRQVVKAYEDSAVGGVSSFPLCEPTQRLSATPYTSALNPGMGFLALASALRGFYMMPGSLVSVKIGLFRNYGGYDSYTRIEQLVDDVAASKRVLAAGKKLSLVGYIPIYNRYTGWVDWWQRWSRSTTLMKNTAPALFWPSPAPTYGAQVASCLLLFGGLVAKKPNYVLPFVGNWALQLLYASINGSWRDALVSPATAWLNLAGWFYPIIYNPKSLKLRGIEASIASEGEEK